MSADITKDEREISTNNVQSHFMDFLNQEGNKRIFFSGKFGIGKTFFLQRFFEMHKDEYDAYHIYPVRYQISSNANIAEILKYDILVELLKKYPDAFRNKRKAKDSLLIAFCKDRGLKVGQIALVNAIRLFGVLGRLPSDLHAAYKELHDEFKKYQDGSKARLEDFVERFRTDLTEKDPIAVDCIGQLLSDRIEELKGDKKSILILDDFDRIDPDHIFRILNVLSAHMEGDEENKFRFDRVIIVGDIDNIKSIFHHKYGKKTEFQGYFDKFFTAKPYIFDNNKAVEEKIPELLKYIQYPYDKSNRDDIVELFLSLILKDAVSANAINLRQLYRPLDHLFQELKHYGDPRSHAWIDAVVRFLIALYGGKDNFKESLIKIKDSFSDDKIFDRNKGDWRYRVWPCLMLTNGIMTEEENAKSKSGKFTWLDKYTIYVDSRSDDVKFKIENDDGHAGFFYDTLWEYIRRKDNAF